MTDVNLRTVNGKLKALWETQPEKEAWVFYDDDNDRHAFTNEDMETLVQKLAAYLFVHGVKRGDVVCNMMTNSVEREIVNFGILLAGAVVMHGEEIIDRGQKFWEPVLRAKAKFLVVSPDPFSHGWKMVKDEIANHQDQDVEILNRFSNDTEKKKVFKFHLDYRIKHQKQRAPGSIRSCLDIIRGHEGSRCEKVSAHTLAALLVSRDPSTKQYHLVGRSHQEIIQLAARLQDMLGTTAADVIYTDKPLSWTPGLAYNYLHLGCTNVKSSLTDCPLRKIVPDTWALMEAERVTMAGLSAPMIQMLVSYCEDLEEPHHKLRAITTNGSDVRHLRQSLMDAIGPCSLSVIIIYSRIEAGLVARLVCDVNNKAMYIHGCVGELAAPGAGCVDTRGEGGKASPVGEILLSGALMSRNYVNDADLTDSMYTEDGYLMTGDIGFFNEERKLFVLGRKSDAIIRGSVPIFPRDIEEKVNQCPGIWKVKVVPIKDERGNTQMCACVIPRNDDSQTMEGVKEFCRYQLGGTANDDDNPHMPSYIFFFDSFPTVGGATNRRMLTYMAQEILDGNVPH